MGSLPQGREPIDTKTLEILADLTSAVMSHDSERLQKLSAVYAIILKEIRNKKENV